MFIINWLGAPQQKIVDEETGLTVKCTESVVTHLITEIITEKYPFEIPKDIQNLIQKKSFDYLKNSAIDREKAKKAICNIIMVNLPLKF